MTDSSDDETISKLVTALQGDNAFAGSSPFPDDGEGFADGFDPDSIFAEVSLIEDVVEDVLRVAAKENPMENSRRTGVAQV